MKSLRDFLRLIRWPNLLFIMLLMWLMEKMVAVPILGAAMYDEQLPAYLFYLLILAVVLIAAGGYAINDYFDVKIDAINRPDKQIVTKTLSKHTAMLAHQIMTGLGVVIGLVAAIVLKSWSLILIFFFVPGLLWFYSSAYKRQFIVGNLIVSFMVALMPMVIALANVAVLQQHYADILPYTTIVRDLYAWLGGFALFAFLCTWIREIIKDLQDQAGDRELECHTLPVKWGEKWTKVIVTVLILLTCGLLCYFVFGCMPFGRTWQSLTVRYLTFGLLVPFACELYLLLSAKIASDYRVAQTLMKFIMLLGSLYSIVFYLQA